MRIDSVNIVNFGKFKNYSLSFSDGLNLVFGNNEDGKTTLMAFLRMMFYGAKSGYIGKNARKIYADRSGGKIGGTVEFTDGGHSYRLTRTFGKTPSGDRTVLYDITAGRDVAVPSARDIGEEFFGMSAGAFERSIFIGCTPTDDDGVSELGAKMASIAATGEEGSNFETVYKRLFDAAASIHTPKKVGAADKIARYTDELKIELDTALHREEKEAAAVKEIAENTQRINELNKKEAVAKKELEIAGLMSGKKQIEDEIQNRRQYKELEEKLCGRNETDLVVAEESLRKSENLAAILKEKEKISAIEFEDGDIAEECTARKNDFEQKRKAEEEIKSTLENLQNGKSGNILWAIFLCLAVASVAVGVALKAVVFYAASGLLIVLATVFLLMGINKKSKAKQNELEIKLKLSDAERQTADAQREYIAVCEQLRLINGRREQNRAVNQKNCAEIEEIKLQISELDKKATEILLPFGENPEGAVITLKNLLSDMRVVSEKLKSSIYADKTDGQLAANFSALNNISTEKSADEIEFELKGITAQIRDLMLKTERLKTEISLDNKGRNASVIENEIKENEKLKASYEEHYNSLFAAMEVLKKADEKMRSAFAPALNKYTGELIGKMTHGKVTDALVNRDLSVVLHEQNEIEPFGSENLSSGCRDQAEFCMRLAIAKLTADKRRLPLLLDDVFMQYDDRRTKEGMEFLCEYAKDNQVLFFTCHNSVLKEAESVGANMLSLG